MQNLAGVQVDFKLITHDTLLLDLANSILIAVRTQVLPIRNLR